MKSRKRVADLFTYAFLVLVLAFVVIPLIYTIAGSFKSNMEIMTHPEKILPIEPTLDNYVQAMSNPRFNIPQLFWNSTWYTVLSMVITLTISTMTGYVFARAEFPGKKVVFAVFSSLMFISIGSITIYPVFEVLDLFGLSTSLWGLIVMKFFSVGIVNIYMVRSYIWTLPKALDEAAAIDGCGFIGTFVRIICPLLKPVLATVSILSFKGAWNDYLMPTLFTMSTPDQRTLMSAIVALKNSGSAASNWNLMLAGATVGLIPVLIVYALFNKHFVDGIAAGAVKG